MQRLQLWVVGIALLTGAASAEALTYNISPNDDVFVETSSDGLTTTAYDEVQTGLVGGQVVWGLGAANGVATGRRRSFLEFTLGTDDIRTDAGGYVKLWLYNYWGANMGGNGNAAAQGTIRVRGTNVGNSVTITEPTPGVPDATWVPPNDSAGWTTILTTATGAVGAVGWYSFDITSWYDNAGRLGTTTSLILRGSQNAGFDFPLFEDREGSAFAFGSDNTIANSGPYLEVFVPEPASMLLLAGGSLLLVRRRSRR